jgi:hypothetical protein
VSSDELAQMLAGVPGVEVTAGPAEIAVHVPAIGDTVRLMRASVLVAEEVSVPTGAPAVRVGIRRRREELPVIVTVDDVVFMPADPADVVEPGLPVPVPAMPHLVAYSEMHRDVRALGRAIDDPELQLDPEIVAATLVLHRCFLAGAIGAGLWPVRVAAWWEYTWSRVGRSVSLPPFRADERWDALMADVTEARRQTAASEV